METTAYPHITDDRPRRPTRIGEPRPVATRTVEADSLATRLPCNDVQSYTNVQWEIVSAPTTVHPITTVFPGMVGARLPIIQGWLGPDY